MIEEYIVASTTISQYLSNLFGWQLYCHTLKLGIEIDDNSHDYKGEYDEVRTQYLKKLGIRIIRYTNKDIYYKLDAVIMDLQDIVEEIEIRKKEVNR